MNYPIWYLPLLGGGTLIALIAITHVFIAHFAVGGGLYLVLAERKGLRENNPAILDFTLRHARFFILVTMVLGSMTGVGIWFAIALVSPGATSLLIHQFVFGWATEWVFFLVEIVAAFVYYYTFGRMAARTHQAVGWVYFAAAWASLFVINGIICFMLTPGDWLRDGNFWSGFFNPTFWPALAFRTFLALMMAGAWAFLGAAWSRAPEVRVPMTRFSGWFVLVAVVGLIPSAWWYLSVLPEPVQALVAGGSPTIRAVLPWGWVGLGVVTVAGLVLTLVRPSLNRGLVAVGVCLCAGLFIGSFEWTREAARRPYLIGSTMYSNGLRPVDVTTAGLEGFLKLARWVDPAVRDWGEGNRLAAGEWIFRHQCHSCHTLGGWNNDLAAATAHMSFRGLSAYLLTMHEKRPFMPPFAGTEAEREALAAWLVAGVHGKPLDPPGEPGVAHPGEALFEAHCEACHGLEEVRPYFAGWERARVRDVLDRLSEIDSSMPDFDGPPEEKDALADLLTDAPGGGAR